MHAGTHGRGAHTTAQQEHAPSLNAMPFGLSSTRAVVQLLTHPQRLQILGIATQLRLTTRTTLYRADSPAEWIFFVSRGVVKAFRDLPSGKRRVMAFLFPSDLVGLAECGRYVNTVQAITPVTVYRTRLDQLMELLKRDPSLKLQFLYKIAHELRESLRQTIVFSRRDAAGRLAMFLRMLEQRAGDQKDGTIDIPMSRSDIANFIGLSLESVIRASHRLEESGLVAFEDLHRARVLHRRRFEELASAV